MKFCSICRNMLYISLRTKQKAQQDGGASADPEINATTATNAITNTTNTTNTTNKGKGKDNNNNNNNQTNGVKDKDGAPVLTYFCKNCGKVEEAATTNATNATGSDPSQIMFTNYADDQTTYKQHVTRYIKHDPTLPRVLNIPCPNPKCTRPSTLSEKVIIVKYDYNNLKYLYHCEHCEVFWKSGDRDNLTEVKK